MHRANVVATMAGAESDEPQERQQVQVSARSCQP